MISLRLPFYDDLDVDGCGNETVAVLETGEHTIPLCEECLNKLMDDINEIREALGYE